MNILMYPRLIEAKLSMNSVTALKFVSFAPALPSIFTRIVYIHFVFSKSTFI